MKTFETDKKTSEAVIKKELIIEKNGLPLNIVYKGRRYILLLTKNDKLLLNKNTD